MMIALHKNARTTPAVSQEIAASKEPASVLLARYGVTEQTINKWKQRTVFADRSHTAHRLQTTLSPAQKVIVEYLRRTLLLPLDDLLAVTREFLCSTLALRTGPLSASSWRKQPAGAQAASATARVQAV